MPRDAVSRTANVERTGRHKWVNQQNQLKTVHIESILRLTRKLLGIRYT